MNAGRVFSRYLRVLGATGIAAVATLVLVAGSAPAHADPSPGEIEDRIDAASTELNKVVEDFNRVRVELEDTNKAIDTLNKKLEPIQKQVTTARRRVGMIAENAYKGVQLSAVNALLTHGSPNSLVDQLTTLRLLAQQHHDTIANLGDATRSLAHKKRRLNDLRDKQRARKNALADKKDTITSRIADLRDMRDKAYGTQQATAISPGPPPAYSEGAAGTAVQFAYNQIGKPYRWGAAGPDAYDCSGLTMAAWAAAGVSLPHNAAMQRNAVPYVSRDELRPGDLVFYFNDLHHVAIYIGNGTVIHAPTYGEPVQKAPAFSMPVHSFGRPG